MMKRKLIVLGSIIMLTVTGCGSNQKDENGVVTVEVPENATTIMQSSTEEESETEKSIETPSEMDDNSEKKGTNGVNAEIGKVRTALSDTGVKPQDLIGLPAGVAPEFTYFIYGTGFDGMVKAQQYLEQIGVSEEGKRLVVLWDQGNTTNPILIDEYTFTDDTIYCVQHSFSSCESNYQTEISNYDENSVDFTDADAFYIRTVATETPISYLASYDTYVEQLNNQYKTVVW